MKLRDYLRSRQKLIDAALDSYMPGENEYPREIHKAMRYSVFSGGKRVRPILVLAACEACGGNIKEAMAPACAIEMIHTYSLVHDDLPEMDDDDYRRGKPTCHKKFGHGIAVLAGDALLTFAFELLSGGRKPEVAIEIMRATAEAIGTSGMIGGQVVDIQNQIDPDLPTLTYINARKTGALIAASCKIGALTARAPKRKMDALKRYGEYIGFTFQVIDDILDKEGFALALGVDGARREAARLINKAHRELEVFGKKARPLFELADFILNRKK